MTLVHTVRVSHSPEIFPGEGFLRYLVVPLPFLFILI